MKDAKEFLRARQAAYTQVFDKDNQFTKAVMEDLAKFCRADQSTFHADQRIHAVLEGRREVWLRISHHINLGPDELWKLYGERGKVDEQS